MQSNVRNRVLMRVTNEYKLAIKIYDLMTKIFPLVASWLPNEKVIFVPCSLKLIVVCHYLLTERSDLATFGQYCMLEHPCFCHVTTDHLHTLIS